MENTSRTRQVADDSTTRALCVLDNEGYKLIRRIYNTYGYSTAVVTQTRFSISPVSNTTVAVTLRMLYSFQYYEPFDLNTGFNLKHDTGIRVLL